MDEQRKEFKRRFASTLLGMRADSKYGSQKDVAAAVNVFTPMSEATYQRLEKLDGPHLPDAYEIVILAKVLEREPVEFVTPKAMTSRERELTRRVARGKRRGQRQADGGA